MFSKNIVFKNFKNKINKNQNKKINNLLKKELIYSSLLLNSLTGKYKYSFKKKI